MHHLTDGFCIPGIFSVPNVLANISETSTQIRTKTTVMLDISPTQATFNVPVVINSTVHATGDIVASTSGANISVTNHDHHVPGIQTGSSTVTTTAPIAGT